MYLLNLKNKHTKLNNIGDIYKLELYLSSTNLSTEEKQTLLKFRTRMVDVKSNFKMKYGQNLTLFFAPKQAPNLLFYYVNQSLMG